MAAIFLLRIDPNKLQNSPIIDFLTINKKAWLSAISVSMMSRVQRRRDESSKSEQDTVLRWTGKREVTLGLNVIMYKTYFQNAIFSYLYSFKHYFIQAKLAWNSPQRTKNVWWGRKAIYFSKIKKLLLLADDRLFKIVKISIN